MKVAVIGAGNIGGTLGSKWAAAGHDVVYGVRSPGAPGSAAIADAVAVAEAVVLAVPGAAAKEVLASLGTALAGKVVIDATNDVQAQAGSTRSTSWPTGHTPSARSTRSAGRTSRTPTSTALRQTSSMRPKRETRKTSPRR